MKSFAATNKAETVDWMEVVNNYIANPPDKLDVDFINYDSLANSWTTCACGQLPVALNRVDYIPNDDEIRSWGIQFSDSISELDFVTAKKFLTRILAKAPYVIAEEKWNADFKLILLQEELDERLAAVKETREQIKATKKGLEVY